MAVVFVSAMAAFVLAVVMVRLLRRRIVEQEGRTDSWGKESNPFPYSAVIQELKQQKFSLENEQQIERRRAKLCEQITGAVIAKLPCGIMFFSSHGLVRQANSAARQILGLASPLGMKIEQLFGEAQAVTDSGTYAVQEVFHSALHGEPLTSDFEISYRTPAGQSRVLNVALIPLRSAQAEELGVASVMRDETGLAELRKAEILRRERSAELALDLRTSLGTIRSYVEQMCAAGDQSTKNLVNIVRSEAERLEKVVGGFLMENSEEKGFAARA